MKDLATAVSTAPRRISSWENGEHAPSPPMLIALARKLQFPVDFFYLDDPPELTTGAVSFRALSRMSARQRKAAKAAGVLAVELATWIDGKFTLPSIDVPDLRAAGPAGAANVVRAVWGMGEKPIRNLIHLLESRGVRVFSVAEDCAEVDAFSFWDAGRPFVILNTVKSAERSRFDAAHELGHLVLHRHLELNDRMVEHEANQFAAAFLMPEDGFCASAVPNASPRLNSSRQELLGCRCDGVYAPVA